ncbi:MAG: hypothetical protein LUE21_06425 [Oscillospiraceae bacterium]|nr:hypothetical protein [Oscillospiraceae bacterium]
MAQKTKKEGLPLVHCIITVALMIVIGMLPGAGPITSYGMKVLGVLVGVVYGMSTVDVFFPSLCAIIKLGLASGSFSDSVVSMFGSTTVWGMIMVFIILYAMQAEHVTDFFANWIINRKVLRGRPWLFSFAILLGDSLLSIISPEAAMLLFWEIIFAVCDTVKIDRKSPWSVAMIFGTCFASGVGIIYLPFMRNGLVVNNQFTAMTGGMVIDPLKYIIAMVPLGICGIIIFILLCKFAFRIDVSNLSSIDDSVVNKDALVLNLRQKIVIGIVTAMIVILLVPSVLPDCALKTALNDLSLLGIASIVVLLFCLIRADGKPIIRIQEAASKGVIWPMVMMVALIAPMGSALTSDDAGIVTLISNVLTPLVSGRPAWVFVAIMVFVSVILTNLAQNLIIMSLMIPIVVAMADTVNINIYAVVILLAIGTHYAVCLPSASPSAGMMFSNPNFKPTFAYSKGLITLLVCCVFLLTVGYLWTNLIF